MPTKLKLILLLFYGLLTGVVQSQPQPKPVFYAGTDFKILGRSFPQQTIYRRFPDSLESLLRKPLWNLSKNSAGLAVYFETNSRQISAKWITGNAINFQHVAGTLVKGLDLYALDNHQWYFAGIGRPGNLTHHSASIVKELDGAMRQYILYLPCYDNTDSLEIGIDSGAVIQSPVDAVLTDTKPLVFYGTSILQGASAMRPGMAYPAILERRLNRETINLGFSGNGHLDSMMAVIMGTIDAACYVIDCGPNLSPQMSEERLLPFLKQLTSIRPGVPVLLVENIRYPAIRFNALIKQKLQAVNSHFFMSYQTMRKEGYKNIYYLPSDGLIGEDGEATVDGTHLTDLGFFRIAGAIEKKLRRILEK